MAAAIPSNGKIPGTRVKSAPERIARIAGHPRRPGNLLSPSLEGVTIDHETEGLPAGTADLAGPASGDRRFLTLGAAQLAGLVRRGDADPVEILMAHIAQIERVNPSIHALVTSRFELAVEEAMELRRRLARDRTADLPLAGVPVTVKDAIAVRGLTFTGGLRRRAHFVASEDAESVRRLRAAGAVVLGKTNCPELSASVETTSRIFGRTCNPWDLARSPGGSSGGEAALIAAGGSALGLGSDLAGSLRIPAAFCGVLAYKPTPGWVSTSGHFPADEPHLEGWNAIGPLGRRVEDLALAVDVLSDHQLHAAGSSVIPARRVMIPAYEGPFTPEADIKQAVQSAADVLAAHGMAVENEKALPMVPVSYEYVANMAAHWLPTVRRELGAGSTLALAARLPWALIGLGATSPGVLASASLVGISGAWLAHQGFGRDGLPELRHTILSELQADGLMLWPSHGSVAPRGGFPWGLAGATTFSAVFNALGLPAVAVPVGRSAGGMPLGVQLVGPPGKDAMLLAAATILEEAFGGWQPPPVALLGPSSPSA